MILLNIALFAALSLLINIALFVALSLLIKQICKDTKESLNNKENEYFKD